MTTGRADAPTVPAGAWAAVVAPVIVTAALVAAGLSQILYVAAIGAVALAAGAFFFAHPLWGVYTLTVYTWAGLGTVVPGPVAPAITAVTLVAAVVSILRGTACRLQSPLFWWSLGFFLLFCISSMLVSWRVDLSLVVLGAYLKAFLVVFLVVQFVDTPRRLKGLAGCVFAGAIATVLLGVLALKLGYDPSGHSLDAGIDIRFSGMHGDPNSAAAYMCAAIPLGVFFLRTENGVWRRCLYALGIAIVAAGVFASLSRSAFFPIAVIIVAIVSREVRGPRSVTLVAVLTAALLVGAPSLYWERVSNLTRIAEQVTSDWSILMRYRALTTAWDLFTSHPLTGIGLGNFIERGAYAVWIRVVVHNSYMEILVGTGVFGLVAMSGLLMSGFRPLVRVALRPWQGAPRWAPHFGFYAAVCMASTLASAVFMSISYRYLLWLPVAIGLAASSVAMTSREARAAGG